MGDKMKSKKLILICTTALISVSTLFVSCGSEETISIKIKSEKKIFSQEIKKKMRMKQKKVDKL